MPEVSIFNVFNLIFIFLLLLYITAILHLKRGLNNLKKRTSSSQPHVSVIVSFHNEERNINSCIRCLLAQTYPKKFIEFIFVDDRSTDQTAGLLKEHADGAGNIWMLTIKQTPRDFAPKKYAIDQAIKQAKGEILIFSDADGRPGPQWVQSMVSYFHPDVGMVIGYAPYRIDKQYNHLVSKLLALEYLSHAAIAAGSCGLGFAVTCVGTNQAYRKKVYQELGGFGKFKNVHSGDDDLFLQRVREESRWQIRYAFISSAHVYNAPPQTLRKFFQQRLRYASKGFLYPWKMSISLVLFVLLNMQLLFYPLLFYFDLMTIYICIAGLALKGFFDYTFLRKTAILFNDLRTLHLYPLAFLLHIPYVVYFAVSAQLQSFEWGGTKN